MHLGEKHSCNLYPGFEHEPGELTKYIEAAGLFSIMLRGGMIVHFEPDSVFTFREWLRMNGVLNIRGH